MKIGNLLLFFKINNDNTIVAEISLFPECLRPLIKGYF